MHIRTCVRGWQGSGPDSAPAKSRSLSLSLSISLLPSIPLFPSFFPFLFSPPSLSPSLSIVIPATSPARYFIIISSLSRLAGFPANDAFPCNDWNPGRGCITHAKITFPTSGNTRRFRNLVSTNTWTIGVRRILRSYEEIVSRECDPDPGREEGSIIFERDGAWTVGSGKVVRRAATAAKEEASRRQGGEEAAVGTSEREGCIRLDRRLSLSNLIIILDYRGPFALVTRHRITRSWPISKESSVKKGTRFSSLPNQRSRHDRSIDNRDALPLFIVNSKSNLFRGYF